MPETASPAPSQAHPGIANGEDGFHDEQTTPQRLESVDLVKAEQIDAEDIVSKDGDGLPRDSQTTQPSRETPSPRDQTPKTEHGDDERPAKRRRTRDTTPNSSPRKPKPVSPPWKKAEAEGPTSFTEGGRRKSGRINTVPLELQRGDKRITRRSLHLQSTPASRTRHAPTNGSPATNQPSHPSTRPTSSGKAAPAKPAPAKPPPAKVPPRRPPAHEPKAIPRTRRRSSSPKAPAHVAKQSIGTRRSTRHAESTANDVAVWPASRTTTRIKLRVRPPLTEIPLVHREQANRRPKLGPSFEEYFQRAGAIPVEEGGLFVAEDGPIITDETAHTEALTILKIEREVEQGGLLTAGRSSVFEPDGAEEPPRQWAHMDHLTKAMSNFRRLVLQEQQRHRATAKKLAIACEAEFRRRYPQPKTAAEIEEEERRRAELAYRVVVKAVAGTWENVRIEINKRRLAAWEVEEQKRVKAALNEAVNLSEQKLQARQARFDTEDLTDDELDEEDLVSDEDDGEDLESGEDAASGRQSSDENDEDEDNMSSSDDDEDKDSVLSDEGLTQDQLREKYASLPALDPLEDDDVAEPGATANGAAETEAPSALDDETSDESIDMDDDLGTTEDDMDSEGGSEADADDTEDEEPSGLLGLFFGKKELKKMKEEAVAESTEVDHAGDVEMDDAAAVPVQEAMPEHSAQNGAEETLPPDLPVAQSLSNGHEPSPGVENEVDLVTEGVSASTTTQLDLEGNTKSDTKLLASLSSETTHDTSALPESIAADPPASVGESVALATPAATEPYGDVAVEDISMVDAPPTTSDTAAQPITEMEPAEASGQGQTSPDTDAVTIPVSPSGSQTPRTSDTRPSDLDTASSVELVETRQVQKPDSGSASPLPNATKTEIPFLLRGTLREYQHDGLDWLAGLYANNTNGILADEMGLGKTIQTIALLAHLACYHEVWGPHLVIVPTSVMLNWEMEFKKWCPAFKILTYYGNQEERKRKRQGWNNDDVWNVCITSYQMVLQDQQVFKRRRWHYMILDEAHNIKNFKSQRWQTLLGFNTHSRLLLTGTPLQNNLTELWSLLFFLMPPENGEGGFADLKEFHDWFHKPESQILESGREQMDDEARAIISKLHKVLRPYLLRRLKADVEKQMPAKYEHVEFCRLSKRQRELYDGFLSRTDTRATLSSGNYLSIINCLMQLRKVCNHPDLFVDRPIMTSFRMQRSVLSAYESTEQLVRLKLLAANSMKQVSLRVLNMIPTAYEGMSMAAAERITQLSPHRILMDLREAQRTRAQNSYTSLDPGTVKSNIVYLESASRWGRFEELQHIVYLNALRRQQRPVYGKGLVDLLTIGTDKRPYRPRPKVPQKIMAWFEEDSFLLRNAVTSLAERSDTLETTISKFACITPPVVTESLNRFVLGERGVEAFEETDLKLSAPVRYAPYMPKEPPHDPWHEARMRLSIQFPDKRLLQYDCGKLQALDKLLRRLQAGGHRALIFTQMTKVLNILEQFLNIHGHKYLRLDGATKVEQRQILTDRFNHDTRILCFILSSRSGGLGINLTGADTVIFYDQDWNPAMDKQCQDRAHRIGQTRDVHIYRLVSEHTIEANILRKASQKQMLDDVVIQEGEFTTDYFNKMSVREIIADDGTAHVNEGDAAANAAMDRVLGGVNDSSQRNAGRVLEQVEDTEDVAAARLAEKEIQQDDADFQEKPTPGPSSGVSSVRQGTPKDGTELPSATRLGQSGLGMFAETAGDEAVEIECNAWGDRMCTIDDYMLGSMAAALEGTPLDLPKDKKKSKKKGKDTRKR